MKKFLVILVLVLNIVALGYLYMCARAAYKANLAEEYDTLVIKSFLIDTFPDKVAAFNEKVASLKK